MKRSLLFFILFYTVCFSYAQIEWGVILSGGMSRITNREYFYNDQNIFVNRESKPFPSACSGITYSRYMGLYSFLETDLCYNFIGEREITNYIFFDSTEVFQSGYYAASLRNHLISVPFFYGMKYAKLEFMFGIQASLFFRSFEKHDGYYWYDCSVQGNVLIEDKHREYTGWEYDYGLKTAVSYCVRSRIKIQCSFYYGFHNLYHGFGDPDDFSRVLQATAGIYYILYNSEKAFFSREVNQSR
ncbi:MAG: hypothetical protein KJ607_05635 [Bacteroidetes bacterium]|nr:hypothetical protein [Bacteroidota bacterium]